MNTRPAQCEDIPCLLDMMAEFYAESGYTLNRAIATRAFAGLLADARLGHVWLIETQGKAVGYLMLTLKFGMEYGGLMACLDDLYVVPASRNQGLSTAALRRALDFCRNSGIRALTVEVDPNNGPAQTVYRRVGFNETTSRQLLALALTKPSHIV